MKILAFYLLMLFSFSTLFSQIQLKPSIGIGAVPSNNTPICTIPVYTGNFYSSGIQEGDTIADFTLYTVNNTPINMGQELAEGKPILLVSGSYTCPVYRQKMQELNAIYSQYAADIKVFIIYTVEAHPTNESPYSGTVWITSQNQQQGILYQQPQTYGQRRSLVNTHLSQMNVMPTVLLDGPCNPWWSYFGPAPNNAYLINTNGTVFRKHGWFNKLPDNMSCDIDSLLGTPCGGTNPSNGSFYFTNNGPYLTHGMPNQVIEVYGTLHNDSEEDVEIEFTRMQNNIPQGWGSAMCADVCLAEWVDEGSFYLQSGMSHPFTMYFYTDNTPNSGHTVVRFKNANDPTNESIHDFYASTLSSEVLEEQLIKNLVFPNPSREGFYTQGDVIAGDLIKIFDLTGRQVMQIEISNTEQFVSTNPLTSGIYTILQMRNERLFSQSRMIKTE